MANWIPIKSCKFGIKLPKSVKLALAMDAMSSNTLWADVISKELKYVRVVLKLLPDGTKYPIDHQFVQCHMLFNINMEISDVRPG